MERFHCKEISHWYAPATNLWWNADLRCTWREEGPVSQSRHVQIDAKVRTSFDPLLINTFFMGFWSGAEAEYLCQAQTGEYSHLKVLFLICTNAISNHQLNCFRTFLLLWIQWFPTHPDAVKDFSDNVWTKDATTNPGLYDSFKVSDQHQLEFYRI